MTTTRPKTQSQRTALFRKMTTRISLMDKTARHVVTVVAALLVTAVGSPAQEPKTLTRSDIDGLARTPPMGWYPWNQFGEEPQNEKLIKEIADALVSSGMRDVGYQYVGPDEGTCFTRGTDGLLTTVLSRYPSGLRGLGDYIHQQGLKYALYTDAGTLTCSKAMPGTKGHEYVDMLSFADWRCDYLKIDWCNTDRMDEFKTYTLLHEAQLAAGRPLVHSICTWGKGKPWEWGAAVSHLWRTTGDICMPGEVNWRFLTNYAWANQKLYASAGPGHWNDPDMLIVGMDGMTPARNKTVFSLWCIMAAPLIAGNDLRTMTPDTIATLTNIEAIAVDQDPLGIQGRVLRDTNRVGQGVSIWGGKPLYDGSQAVVLYSQHSHKASVTLTWAELGLDDSTAMWVRNLWTHETTGPVTKELSFELKPGETVMLRISPTNTFPIPPIISADTYRLTFTASGTKPETLKGSLTTQTAGTDELPLWKVQKDLPPWLSVRVEKQGKRQVFENVVSTAGLKKGSYHAHVRMDNHEPRTGMPLSALYYDVDLEVTADQSSD